MDHESIHSSHAVDIENNNNLYKYDSVDMDCEATFPSHEEEEAAEDSYEEAEWEQEPFDPWVPYKTWLDHFHIDISIANIAICRIINVY